MSAHTATDAGGLGPIDVSIDGEAEEPPANLNTLPVDVLLHLAAMLDGVDLAALEATASNIRRLLRGQLAPLWVALHAQIDKVPDHRADDSDAKRKSDYVRVWAWTQQRCARPPTCISRPDPISRRLDESQPSGQPPTHNRCPRCGKRGRRPHPKADPDETVEFDASRYMHLCDWLQPTRQR